MVMNREIVKIHDREGKKTANARELWSFLESKQEFSNWIKNRIENYGFIENVDFTVFDNFINDEKAFGGRRKVKDYYVSISMAKELSMVENNENGKIARRYFIECEENNKKPMSQLDLMESSIKVLREHEKRLETLEKRIDNAEKGKFIPIPESSEDEMVVPTQIGKMFNPAKSGMEINKLLKQSGFQYRVSGEWIPSEKGKKLCQTYPVQLENGKVIYQIHWKRKIKMLIDSEVRMISSN